MLTVEQMRQVQKMHDEIRKAGFPVRDEDVTGRSCFGARVSRPPVVTPPRSHKQPKKD